jgi:3-carboxy-cis,cis-muconate cycloisomerase
VLEAMVEVERAYLAAWCELLGVESGGAPSAEAIDEDALLRSSRQAGVPVVGLVHELRRQGGERVHQGMTSQDVLDTALMIVSKDALGAARAQLETAGRRLRDLALEHRATPTVARTLTQEAEPTTLGAAISVWLDAVTSALEVLASVSYPVQLGGAVGNGNAMVRRSGDPNAVATLRRRVAEELGLTDPGRSWHTERTAVLTLTRAAASVCAAGGRIGRDLGLLARDGLITPGHGGGSSSMPHKHNPVDAVLLVANGLRAGGALAVLQSAALSYDARPAGEWQAEWQAWRETLRLAAESASLLDQASSDLVVHGDPGSNGTAGRSLDAGARGAHESDTIAAARVVDAAVERFDRVAAPGGTAEGSAR